MQQKSNKTVKSLEGLMNVHMKALQENSDDIVKMLEALSKKKLKEKDAKELKSIKKALNRINDELDDLAFAEGEVENNSYADLEGFI